MQIVGKKRFLQSSKSMDFCSKQLIYSILSILDFMSVKKPPWNYALAIAPQFLFCVVLLSFCFVHCWPRVEYVYAFNMINTIAFPQNSSLHTVNSRGSVISLTGGFLSWCIPLGRCDMFIANPSSSNGLIEYVASTVFCKIWPEHSIIDKEQNHFSEFFYFRYFSHVGF